MPGAALASLDLPFRERSLVELLETDHTEPDPDFAGYGWARAASVWLDGAGPLRRVDDALVIAVHAADDGAVLDDDVDLQFERPDAPPVRVLASTFLAAWWPHLPHDVTAVVVVMCNPHRAALTWPGAPPVPVHYGAGEVVAWGDPGGRVRLVAEAWRTLPPVSTELEQRPNTAITDDEKQTYAGLYLLKKLDLDPKEGGLTLPIVLPSDLGPLEDLLHQLAIEGRVELNAKKDRYDLTKAGIAYLVEHIDEAEALVEEFDDEDLPDVIAELRSRNLDPYRARFLWGWFQGELDDLVRFQEQRGVKPVERLWAFYLVGDDLWNELGRDLNGN